MKKLCYLLFALALTSCGTNKFLTSSVPAEQVKDMNYIEPITYIHYVEKGNKSVLSDSLSQITARVIDSVLQADSSRFKLSDKMIIANDSVNARIENELNYLSQMTLRYKKLDEIALPPTLDSIMQSNDERFAMIIVASGFGRKKGNYGGQVAKGIAVGILTLGMAVPSPVKSNLTLYGFILDKEKHNVAFYQRLLPNKEKEPTDPQFINTQLHKLFEGYLYPAQ